MEKIVINAKKNNESEKIYFNNIVNIIETEEGYEFLHKDIKRKIVELAYCQLRFRENYITPRSNIRSSDSDLKSIGSTIHNISGVLIPLIKKLDQKLYRYNNLISSAIDNVIYIKDIADCKEIIIDSAIGIVEPIKVPANVSRQLLCELEDMKAEELYDKLTNEYKDPNDKEIIIANALKRISNDYYRYDKETILRLAYHQIEPNEDWTSFIFRKNIRPHVRLWECVWNNIEDALVFIASGIDFDLNKQNDFIDNVISNMIEIKEESELTNISCKDHSICKSSYTVPTDDSFKYSLTTRLKAEIYASIIKTKIEDLF